MTADVNQVAFFAKGSTYRVSHSAEHGDRGTVFEVCPRVLGDILRELDPASADAAEPVFPSPRGPATPAISGATANSSSGSKAPTSHPLEPLWADATALQLVADVLEAGYVRHGSPRKKRRAGTVEAHADRVEAVKALLASRMTERLTLGEVAEEVHVSPFHLARLFRQGTGVPIHRYLTRLRLRASLERLAGDGTDLTTIALDLGFASHSHFADAFRREFACPPPGCAAPAAARSRKCAGIWKSDAPPAPTFSP